MSRRGWALFLAMAVIWGIPYLLIRVAVRQLDPGVMVLFRYGVRRVLLMPIVISSGPVLGLIRNFKWIAAFAIVEFGVLGTSWRRPNATSQVRVTSLLICCVPLWRSWCNDTSNG